MVDAKAMKQHAADVIGMYSTRDTQLYNRYREMYFMEDESKRPKNAGVDEKDWAITVSPSSRNEVTGMVRLLDTGELHISAKSNGEPAEHSSKIENALLTILRVSGVYRRARIESDAALSAVLYGPVVLYAESLKDLQMQAAKKQNKARVTQLERIGKNTPFLIRSINPEQSYPEWGEFGLISHIWRYKLDGGALRDRWGLMSAKVNQTYTVLDIMDSENRLVYCEDLTDNEYLYAGPHGLNEVPVVSRYAGGSSLFVEPERQLGSFLYAKAKSRLDKAENALLTTLRTAINMRGLMGPLLAIDPENAPDTITISHVGGVRYMVAKAVQVDDKVIDPVVFQWRELLKQIGGESTIHGQTLGQANNAGTFSGLAMLSSAGKLPLVDSQRAIEMSFTDIFTHILQRIKNEGIENSLIMPKDIPDDIELTVTLEPNLPQDKLRNAQVAQSLGDLVSDEWKHTNLLQVGDSEQMRRQSTKELLVKAIVNGIIQSPEIMQQMIATVVPSASPAPTEPPMDGGMQDGMQDGMMPPGMTPEMLQQMQGMQGAEQMPRTDPMIPPAERT